MHKLNFQQEYESDSTIKLCILLCKTVQEDDFSLVKDRQVIQNLI